MAGASGLGCQQFIQQTVESLVGVNPRIQNPEVKVQKQLGLRLSAVILNLEANLQMAIARAWDGFVTIGKGY